MIIFLLIISSLIFNVSANDDTLFGNQLCKAKDERRTPEMEIWFRDRMMPRLLERAKDGLDYYTVSYNDFWEYQHIKDHKIEFDNICKKHKIEMEYTNLKIIIKW